MGMGRTRSKGREGWPPNLYPCKGGFKYRNPQTRKESWMGVDRTRAFAAAKTLNAMLVPSCSLVQRVIGAGNTIADAAKLFRSDDVPGKNWAPSTAREYEIIVSRIERLIGDRDTSTFSVRDAAEFLREHAPGVRARQQVRLVLGWFFTRAMREGWIDTNPVLVTDKGTFQRQRERLTRDTFDAIRAKAEPWLRNAMDLSLVTLLRLDDVVSARFADFHDGALWIVPKKTARTTGARLKIVDTGPLGTLVARCRDTTVSPYLIHRLPERARPTSKRAAERVHHTQVLPEKVSRAFADARSAAGIESENPPTFHEIRSLGGALLRAGGWTEEQVQALMNHASKTMTQVYLAGHEKPWTEVATGLAIGRD